jgi:hypothetical protein
MSDNRVGHLIRMLGSQSDGEALAAARALVKELASVGGDLDALAKAWEKHRPPASRPKPIEIDWAVAETVIKSYVANKTKVRFNAVWSALRRQPGFRFLT